MPMYRLSWLDTAVGNFGRCKFLQKDCLTFRRLFASISSLSGILAVTFSYWGNCSISSCLPELISLVVSTFARSTQWFANRSKFFIHLTLILQHCVHGQSQLNHSPISMLPLGAGNEATGCNMKQASYVHHGYSSEGWSGCDVTII